VWGGVGWGGVEGPGRVMVAVWEKGKAAPGQGVSAGWRCLRGGGGGGVEGARRQAR
jgi:hypothetical protein